MQWATCSAALALRELVERARVLARQDLAHLLEIDGAPGRTLAQPVQQLVARDAEHPGAHQRVAAKAGGALPDVMHRVHRHFARLVRIGQLAQGECVHLRSEHAIELRERCLVAVCHARDQFQCAGVLRVRIVQGHGRAFGMGD